MSNAALDCETWPIRPGQLAPRMVCVSFGTADRPSRLYHREDAAQGWIPEMVNALREAPEIRNQNIGFDWAVLLTELQRLQGLGKLSAPVLRELTRLVWAAYDDDRIRDPMITAMLIGIAKGEPMPRKARKIKKLHGFSLGALVEHYLGETVEGKHGPDVWRPRYNELDAVPICDWPQAAKAYALGDPVYADRVFSRLRAATRGERPRSELRQTRAAWALTLAEAWGVRTDPRYVAALKSHLLREKAAAFATIRETIGVDGWLRPDGSKNEKLMKARIVEASERLGLLVNKSAKGAVSMAREWLEPLADAAPDLGAWAKIGATKTELSTFIPALEKGVALPINAYWSVLVESGRLACGSPNLTNQPTREISLEGDPEPIVARLAADLVAAGMRPKIGIRSCFVPRPGWAFISADYATAEMRAFAQICLSWFSKSRMAEILADNVKKQAAGLPFLDLHDAFAARILGLTGAEALAQKKSDPYKLALSDGRIVPRFKTARQLAKRINFGRLGGMGDQRFVDTAKKDGVDITLGGLLGTNALAVAAKLGQIWKGLYPEVAIYHRQIGNWIRQSGGRFFRATSYGDGLVRGNVGFPDGANHFFQNLVAQWLKDALYLVSRECYLVESSPLYGARPVILPHDEIIAEVPEARASVAGARLAELMRQAGQALCPDVPVEVDPAKTRRWYKGAEAVYDDLKNLDYWEPLAA